MRSIEEALGRHHDLIGDLLSVNDLARVRIELEYHMRWEEEKLFPAAAHLVPAKTIESLLIDHERIRRSLDEGDLEQLRVFLEGHNRDEEFGIYPAADKGLSEKARMKLIESFRGIPSALDEDHEELHAELVKLTKKPGKVGEAAREVAKLLHPHFEKEEAYALPPLGLLQAIVEGKPMEDTRRVLEMTEKLKRDLPEMLAEHKAILAALEKLEAAGEAKFAAKLKLHAQTEEQVLYPAAILVGEILKCRESRSC